MDKPRISLIPGDGIGPEISTAMRKVVDASSAQINWEVINLGARKENGEEILKQMITSLSKNKVGIKGPITTPIGTGQNSLTVALRKKLGLFANVRPVKRLPGLGPDLGDTRIDLVMIRENTEGLYYGVEHRFKNEFAEAIRLTTYQASEKIARFAFEYALRFSKDKVTVIHKANILKETDGLFLEAVRSISEDYKSINLEEKIVDNMALQLLINPEEFNVLLAPNLYGDILSDLAAGLIGGLGVAPSGNFGDNCAVFEAVHGSAPDIAGKNIANPLGLIRSATMMLSYLDQDRPAGQIDAGVERLLTKGDLLTPDLGGTASTGEVAERIIELM